MVAGPEISKIFELFEKKNVGKGPTFRNGMHHHEQAPWVQITFAKQTCSLVATLGNLGNPFMEISFDLLAIHANDFMLQEVVSTARNIQKLDQGKYDAFVAERLLSCNRSITDILPKISLQDQT
ncbi:hypothetical protein Hamer_G002485 [Homarus americanus]|uniref:Uncharacterized protein n=1 Tax=Homarus americanus TaxID=6706 RepID=A0A8J5K1F7_HOMAM|nr:hypothetical protein Hamer_G002485 [Homarus americanus]